MSRVLLVMLGGALGAAARYGVGELLRALYPTRFPLATFLVNVTGSFIAGCFLTFAGSPMTGQADLRLFLVVGFVGAYTTFSTFEYETFRLFADGHLLIAAANVGLSVMVGFTAVVLGVMTGRWLSTPAG